MSLTVNVRHLERGEVALQGDLPPAELALDSPDELIQARQPLHYDLVAQKTGRDILVQGKVGLTLDCECARCLKGFQYRVELPQWVAHLSLEGEEKVEIHDDKVDLTPFLREDILLEFPQHPLCDERCAGLPPVGERAVRKRKNGGTAAGPLPESSESSVWSELNKLKF
jgi:uncharacterized protein